MWSVYMYSTERQCRLESDQGSSLGSTFISAVSLDKLLDFSKPQFPHLKWEYGIYFKELGGLNEIIYVLSVGHTYSKCSEVNIYILLNF